MTDNKNHLTDNTCDLQMKTMETLNRASAIFKYLKIKVKLKKTVKKNYVYYIQTQKMMFTKQKLWKYNKT